MKFLQILLSVAILFVCCATCSAQESEIPNPLIDSKGYLSDTVAAFELRKERRVTEEEFLRMAKEKNTIILDTRSKAKFEKMHVAGAVHLGFSEFTEETLAEAIPSKDTRVLIYCNNNFENERIAFPTKAFTAPLNLPTFGALYSYGYRNVYELGPMLDPAKAKLEFRGVVVKEQKS